MTVVETEQQKVLLPQAGSKGRPKDQWKNVLVFGTALGVEIGEKDLHVVIARARPSGVTVVAKISITDFRSRPAKEWGTEFHRFLSQNGERHLSATVLLSRRDVIVRLASVPGVTKKDIPSALAFQIDSMHPYGDEEVAFAWSPTQAGTVLVGIIRKAVLDGYVTLFQDAGVPVAAFTFSASAIFSALRIHGAPPHDFVALYPERSGAIEIYGESAAKPVFSAEFDMPMGRAAALARAELRIVGDESSSLENILPRPKNIIAFEPLAYATALAALARVHAPLANLLPADKRTVHSRARWIPTLVLAAALLGVGIAWLVYVQLRDQRYLARLHAQIAQVQPLAIRANTIDRRAEDHHRRVRLLDSYRARAQGDIEALAELTRLLPPAVWTNGIEINEDTVTLTGEADSAAPLLKLLDSSPLFRNSEFSMGVIKSQAGETFRIRTYRKARK